MSFTTAITVDRSPYGVFAPSTTTEVRFTHARLAPEYECFDACSTTWRYYVNTSLRNRIANGRDAR